MDYNTLFDLVRLSNYYEFYKEKRNKEYKEFSGNEEKSKQIIVMQYAKFVTLAIICYLIKIKRGKTKSYLDSGLLNDNINGTIICNYKNNDFEQLLFEMFTVIIEILSDVFEKNMDDAKTPSNFFKTDNNYRNIILKDVENKLKRIVYKDNFENYIKIFDN